MFDSHIDRKKLSLITGNTEYIGIDSVLSVIFVNRFRARLENVFFCE